MEIIIKCEECGKNICVTDVNYDLAGMCDIDYTCPICGYDGTYALGSSEVNDDDIFDIDYLYSMCDYEDACDLESAEGNDDDDDDSYDLE